MANAAPSSVRPSTNGTSSSIAVTRWRPRISELRSAGYQKSHKNPASTPRSDVRIAPLAPPEASSSAGIRAESIIVLTFRASPNRLHLTAIPRKQGLPYPCRACYAIRSRHEVLFLLLADRHFLPHGSRFPPVVARFRQPIMGDSPITARDKR